MIKLILWLALLPASALSQGLWLPAQIQGFNTRVMLDTGASHWVLSETSARKIGLPLAEHPARLMTTAGPVRVFGATLQSISLSGFDLPPQQVWIVPGAYPQYPLAGLSALKNLRVIIENGQVRLLKP